MCFSKECFVTIFFPVYPLATADVPLGVRFPPVENCCNRHYFDSSCANSSSGTRFSFTGPYYKFRTYHDMIHNSDSKDIETLSVMRERLKWLPLIVAGFFIASNYFSIQVKKTYFALVLLLNRQHIHSFIPDISIAPLQVHYYSEAISTTALILCQI